MTDSYSSIYTDVLIIGSGGAGLTLALKLADQHRVTILSKLATEESNTRYAQGGISAVFDDTDSIDSHIQDTLKTGEGLCDPDIVTLTVKQGKQSIDWLIKQGVSFTYESKHRPDSPRLHLNREGGHSHRRIVHAADATGQSVISTLMERAQEHCNITLLEHYNAIDLVTDKSRQFPDEHVIGAYALDSQNNAVIPISARIVVLATGGANKVYLYTSNPDIATGDGLSLAWRAGCRIANMEFMQFHPTCLYHPDARSFLISEAIRGEGAKLLLPNGEPFMHLFDSREELAPRDIVARAIDHQIKKYGIDFVYLDISHKSPAFIHRHFPNIYQQCLKFNIDITSQKIPVVPAAHYTCGGIITDSYSKTDVSGLYAIGEVACTGLHGANRMASNSLLECLVFASQAAESILRELPNRTTPVAIRPWDESQVAKSNEEVVIAHNWDEIRRVMWDYVGIVRSDKRLSRARERINLLKAEIHEYYSDFTITSDLLELRNLVIVAELIIMSAQQRKESRGLHYNQDYPEQDNRTPPKNTILSPQHYSPAFTKKTKTL